MQLIKKVTEIIRCKGALPEKNVDYFPREKSQKARRPQQRGARYAWREKIMKIVAFTGIHRKKLTIVEKINSFKIREFFHSN